jgi:LGFP repeat
MRGKSVVAAVLSLLCVLAGTTSIATSAGAATSWVASGPGVFGLGDSLFLQCGESLGVGTRSRGMVGWAGGTTEAMRARLSTSGGSWPYTTEPSHAAELAAFRDAPTLVVGLGTNDVHGSVSATRFRANVDWFMARAEGRPVLWFDLHNPAFSSRVAAFNTILAGAADRWPNLRILDWSGYVAAHPDAVMDDGVHLASYTACREGRLALIRAAVPPVAGQPADPGWEDPPPQDPPAPDPVTAEYTSSGGPAGPLGPPTGPVSCQRRADGCVQFFAHGGLTWTADTGVQRMSEPVARAWSHYSELGRVGYPVAAEICGMPGGGCRQRFEHGWMFWSPATDAWDLIDGPLLDRYLRRGGANGDLGYPLGIPACGAARDGCVQRFQGGALYWSGRTGAHIVSGAVRTGWMRTGGPSGALGYPLSDTICGLVRGGCGQNFSGGSVYWSPKNGVHAVTGVIRSRWIQSGGVSGRLGYPVTDRRTISGGWSQRFSGGTLTYRHGRWT